MGAVTVQPDYTLDEFGRWLDQLVKNGLKECLSLPGLCEMIRQGETPEEAVGRIRRIIGEMTEEERGRPDTIDATVRSRVAAASGTQPQDVERILAAFDWTREMIVPISRMTFWQRLRLVLGFGRFPGSGQ